MESDRVKERETETEIMRIKKRSETVASGEAGSNEQTEVGGNRPERVQGEFSKPA